MHLARAPSRELRTWAYDSRRWAEYAPRESDIVIATYPKCGTTWMQRIVGGLVFLTPEPMPFTGEISVWIDFRIATPLDEALSKLEAQAHRRFLKAHLPFDALPIYDEVKYIHVARDGRDALMSWHNHSNAFLPEVIARLDSIGLADETIGRPYPDRPVDPADEFHRWITTGNAADECDGLPSTSYFRFEASWWEARHRPNVLMVHYNDLKADLAGETARLAAFLDITVPDELMPRLVEAARFEAMQRDGEALLPHAGRIFQDGHRRFLNKGTNNRWRGVFRDDDLVQYREKLDALPPECAAWLEHGRAPH